MDRHNIWIHIGLACVLVTFAAVLGQMDRWRASLSVNSEKDPIIKTTGTAKDATSPELIVRFRPGTSLDKIRETAAINNDRLTDEIESVPGLTVIDDLDDADAAQTAAEYAERADVLYAELNHAIALDAPMPNDPFFSEQWALNNPREDSGLRADLDAVAAWTTTTGSDEVVVAVIDSGVDYRHPDLDANMWRRPANVPPYVDDELGPFEDDRGFGIRSTASDPMDDNGHGTHCAGIIGAEGDNGVGIAGVNWKVRIMPVKFLDGSGIGDTENAIAAINYVIDRRKAGVNVRVINASWGSNEYSKALEDTIRAAGDAGILFVAAAGNDGSDNDVVPHYPSSYDLPNVVSVAAVDRNDRLTAFSNFGVKTVQLAAPGKDILSTWPGNTYREASGTSMATPFVSGVAALIVAGNAKISVADLRKRLLTSADPLPQLDGRVATGARLCAANSLALRPSDHKPHAVNEIVSGL